MLEHYLFHEHALLQLPPATEAASDNATQTEGPAGRCSPQEELSSVVEVMFRKARLKRCFQQIIFRQQQRGNDNRKEPSAASPSGLVLHRPCVGDRDARVAQRTPIEQAEPSPQLEELHPGRAQDVVELRSPEGSAPAVDPPPPREEGQDEAERARRRILLRRFFDAARRRDFVGRNDRLDLGQGGTPAAAGGAPCFTVGGSGRGSNTSARLREQYGPGDMNAGVVVDDNGGARLRRANLLRRILHALRWVLCRIQAVVALCAHSTWWVQLFEL